MSSHLIDGEFQSDKYPTCPRGKVPLSVRDPTAQDLLWTYAQRRRAIDAEFSNDLEAALTAAGYRAEPSPGETYTGAEIVALVAGWLSGEPAKERFTLTRTQLACCLATMLVPIRGIAGHSAGHDSPETK